MDDPPAVGRVQAVRDLDSQIKQLFDSQGALLERVLQRAALQQLHGDEGAAFVIADIVDGANVGMVQRRSGSRLAQEAFQRGAVFGGILRKEFEGNLAAQAGVLGLIDDSHAAAAQFLQYAVMRDSLADQVPGSRF